jgi:DNA repair protein RadD
MGGTSDWMAVDEVSCTLHQKYSDPSAPPSMRVDYLAGLSSYSEYISFQRTGYPREIAERWWFAMGGAMPAPRLVEEALDRLDELATVQAIVVARDGKWWRVVNRRLRLCDGKEVEVNQACRVFVARIRPAPIPDMNDEIPY